MAEPTTTRPQEPEGHPAAVSDLPESVRRFLAETAIPKRFVNPKPLKLADLRRRVHESDLRLTVPPKKLLASANLIRPAPTPVQRLPEDIQESLPGLKERLKRFHGIKIPLYWFPLPWVGSTCADRFGYMSSAAVRNATKLPFNVATQALLGELGGMMGDPGREPNPTSQDPADAGVSSLPAGFMYFGQFVDHDITLDVSSTLDVATDAEHHPQHAQPVARSRLASTAAVRRSTRSSTRSRRRDRRPRSSCSSGTNQNVGPGGPGGDGGARRHGQRRPTSTCRACPGDATPRSSATRATTRT